MVEYLSKKIENVFLFNDIMADQFKLIGSCIKSDHFKDFYNSKSYLQLEREVFIKTQVIRQDIVNKILQKEGIVSKFEEFKKNKDDWIEKYYNFKAAEANAQNNIQNNKKPTLLTNIQNKTK